MKRAGRIAGVLRVRYDGASGKIGMQNKALHVSHAGLPTLH
jgi:hypothetical protein